MPRPKLPNVKAEVEIARRAVDDAHASLAAALRLKESLQSKRVDVATELQAAQEALQSAAQAMATGADGLAFHQASRSVAELQARLVAIDDHAIPPATADAAARTRALTEGLTRLASAEVRCLVCERLIPADQRLFEATQAFETALNECAAARDAVRAFPRSHEFVIDRFGSDALDPRWLAGSIVSPALHAFVQKAQVLGGVRDPIEIHLKHFDLQDTQSSVAA